MNNLKKELMTELKQIWDNKDFVCGAMSNAATEENWLYMLDYIKESKRTGKTVNSDDILLLSLALSSDEKSSKELKVACSI